MSKLILVSGLLLVIAGCSAGSDYPAPVSVESVAIDEATMANFIKRKGRIDEQAEPGDLPAAALRIIEKGDPRLAVIIRNPGRILRRLGVRGNDRIVMIDRDNVADLFQEEWGKIGEDKKANAFDTLKYTDFVNQIFSRREKSDSVQLLVYRRRNDAAENPFAIRIEFTE